MGNLVVGEISLQLIEALRPIAARVKRKDRSLADQLVRAASSVALNIAEADYSDAGNKRARLFTAAGSANETRAALPYGFERERQRSSSRWGGGYAVKPGSGPLQSSARPKVVSSSPIAFNTETSKSLWYLFSNVR